MLDSRHRDRIAYALRVGRALAGSLAVLSLLAFAACGQRATRDALREMTAELASVRAGRAATCAPAAITAAHAHVAQARADLEAGNTCGADDEIARASIALAPVRAAATSPSCRPVEAGGDRDGDGLLDQRDGCPERPEDLDGYVDGDGCPDPDNDDDGLLDPNDRCPRAAEDADGYQDDDGCPDPDNDGDGILDVDDRCPLEAEDRDGHRDDDGCPDCDDDFDGVPECPQALDRCPGQAGLPPDGCGERYHYIKMTEAKIELKQTIYFATNKAAIKKASFPLLAEVAQAMADHPTIRVRVEGHTDSQANDAFNLRLSQRRADAVRRHLIGLGVAADRMVAEGFGETVPIADNRTRAGRDANRRVDFVIVAR